MSNSTKAQIGQKIAEAVKQNGINEAPSVLSHWRKGRCLPSLEKFLQICAHAKSLDIGELVEIANPCSEKMQ